MNCINAKDVEKHKPFRKYWHKSFPLSSAQ